jgi:hypothetical protein
MQLEVVVVDSEVVVEVVLAVGVVAFVEGAVQGVAEVALPEAVDEVVALGAEEGFRTCIIYVLLFLCWELKILNLSTDFDFGFWMLYEYL